LALSKSTSVNLTLILGYNVSAKLLQGLSVKYIAKALKAGSICLLESIDALRNRAPYGSPGILVNDVFIECKRKYILFGSTLLVFNSYIFPVG
jgi:hypothetical protein